MTPDITTLAVIALAAALAPIIADLAPRRVRVPVVVVELLLGILIGPQILGWAEPDELVDFLSNLGVAFLFFMAGLEIDFRAIRGAPTRLASLGWLWSLAAGLAVAGLLAVEGVVISSLLVGTALCTTALGTLVPILRDEGVTGTAFGTAVLAVGAAGELFPIVMISVVLGADAGAEAAVLLAIFALATVILGFVALRYTPPRISRLVEATMDSTGQLAVRLSVLLVVGLTFLAERFGLDIVLGGFAAGLVAGLFLKSPSAEPVVAKLDAVAYGVFVPIFFIQSGMSFDADALFGSATAALKVPLFLALFLVVRGLPAVLWAGRLPRPDILPLALLSATALPLVVAITEIGLETGRMATDTAAALIAAGILSVMLYPLGAFVLRKRRTPAVREVVAETGH